MGKNLGFLRKLNLREIFPKEAKDFTPWLAQKENLLALGTELGLDIQLIGIEVSVGPFSVDILGEQEATGRKVIIENQLDVSDHDHLGKLMTYASGHNAKYIVWVFKDIRDEHLQAIEWLNEHSDNQTHFFAVKVEVWQIDNSAPAVKFSVLAKPNLWTRTVRIHKGPLFTHLKLQQLEFWTQFKLWLEEKPEKIRLQMPMAKHYANVTIGSPLAHIVLTVHQGKGTLGCSLYIPNNKKLFDFLLKNQSQIESKLGASLDWQEPALSIKSAKIRLTQDGFEIPSSSPSYKSYEWLQKQTLNFQLVFLPFIQHFQHQLEAA